MSPELFTAFLGFAFVTLMTPGPNNLMLMASGANYGVRRTVPHMLGIALGFAFMVVLVGVGLMGLFERVPPLQTVLRLVSIGFLLWLAWKIAHAAAPGSGKTTGRPLTFSQAAAFQWVNPKAWAMALATISAYAPERSLWAVALLAATYCVMTLGSTALWASAGTQVRRLLTNPRRLLAFNWTMAALLVATLIPVLFA